MDDKVLWGIVILVYVGPFAAFEIARQARGGDGYSPDRWTAWGWGGFAVLLALWAIKVPAAFAILLLLVVGVAAAARYGLRVLRARRAR